MIIGTIKEIKDSENRVALTPHGARELREHGHTVLIQKGAGVNTGFSDQSYERVGAELIERPIDVVIRADLLVKVKEPLPGEYGLLDNFREKTLFTFLHLAGAEVNLTEKLLANNITAIGYETVENESGELPILRPMSQMAGVLAVQYGAEYLQNKYGGIGTSLGKIDNAPRAKVTVLGGGAVGTASARTAAGMGALVTIIELNDMRIAALKKDFESYLNVSVVKSNPVALTAALGKTDLLICAVLVAGSRAPVVVSEENVRGMKRGAVIIDVAIDQGGSTAYSRPTSHSHPIFAVEGRIFCCIPNMPGQAALQATLALTNTSLPYLLTMADGGILPTLRKYWNFARGLNTYEGFITHRAVADSLCMQDRYREFSSILPVAARTG
jgi:alanine dehydrogenase